MSSSITPLGGVCDVAVWGTLRANAPMMQQMIYPYAFGVVATATGPMRVMRVDMSMGGHYDLFDLFIYLRMICSSLVATKMLSTKNV